jgi:hypothetical protein
MEERTVRLPVSGVTGITWLLYVHLTIFGAALFVLFLYFYDVNSCIHKQLVMLFVPSG